MACAGVGGGWWVGASGWRAGTPRGEQQADPTWGLGHLLPGTHFHKEQRPRRGVCARLQKKCHCAIIPTTWSPPCPLPATLNTRPRPLGPFAGLPPPFARGANAEQLAREHLQLMLESGVPQSEVGQLLKGSSRGCHQGRCASLAEKAFLVQAHPSSVPTHPPTH